MELPEHVFQRAQPGTRVGSVPSWVQSSDEAPEGPWQFVLQIDCTHRLSVTPQSADEIGTTLTRRTAAGHYHHEQPATPRAGAPRYGVVDQCGSYVSGPNFGGDGCAYVFLRLREGACPEGRLLWQCG